MGQKPWVRIGLVSVISLGSCTTTGSATWNDQAGPPPTSETTASGSSVEREIEFARGRVACHDPLDDVLSEGSGDQSGPAPSPPDPSPPGSDLSGVSFERDRAGLTLNFGTKSPVPIEVPARARLHYVFAATTDRPIAAISAVLYGDEWVVEVREDRDTTELGRPEVARNVLGVNIDAEDVPALMRNSFRWKAHSEWVPKPTDTASEIFVDYCPDQGSPVFRGTST